MTRPSSRILRGFQYKQKHTKHFIKAYRRYSSKLGFEKVDFFVFKTTGGSNLDPDDDAVDLLGNSYSLERDICQKYDLILAITDYSLTAPLTAFAKKYGFRGATLHGVNEIILNSGLSVDYRKISEQAECFRSVLDQADSFVLHFQVNEQEFELQIDCGAQIAQKSHGLCPPGKPGELTFQLERSTLCLQEQMDHFLLSIRTVHLQRCLLKTERLLLPN